MTTQPTQPTKSAGAQEADLTTGTPDGKLPSAALARRILAAASGIVLMGIVVAGCGQAVDTAATAPRVTATPVADEQPAPKGPSAAEVAAGLQATVTSNAAAARERAGATRLLAYRAKAGVALQDYANALGTLRERDRQIGERPTLVTDAEWLARTTMAMQRMQLAVSQLTAIEPLPPEMAITDALIRQLDGETRLLTREYGLGIERAAPAAITEAGRRTSSMLELLAQANRELRRGAA